MLRGLPSDSRFAQSLGGERFAWNTADHLLATIVDLLAGANWQRGGGKSARPKPIQRPGDEAAKDTTRMGKARPLAEVRQILDDW